jgi:predicted phosphodiesterase
VNALPGARNAINSRKQSYINQQKLWEKGESMNTMMKKTLTGIICVLAFAVCSTSAFAALLKNPYLIYPGVNSQMEVLWQDTQTETTNTVSWGTDTTYSLGSVTVPENNSTQNQHMYTITGLAPDTKYYFQVADATNGVYGTGSFITGPAATSTHVKFLAMGDSRNNPVGLDAEMQAMASVYLNVDPEYQRLCIHNGDWVSSDGEGYWTNQWFVPTMANHVNFALNTPIDGVKGNHDNSSGFSTTFPKYFPFPYPNETPCNTTVGSPDYLSSCAPGKVHNLYWSMDYGPVHFTFVDEYSSYAPGSPQYAWLVNDLATTTKPWKILVYHEPAYSAGEDGDNTTVRQLETLVTQYAVDLIYCGHSHNYARTGAYNLTQANGDPIALNVPHITSGGGGSQTYTIDLSNANGFPHVITGWQAYEFMTFDINGKTLTMTAYQVNNAAQAVNTSWPWVSSSGTANPSILTVPATNGCLAGTSSSCPETSLTPIETIVLNHFTNVSSQVAATTTGYGYNRVSKLYTTNLTVTNNSASPLTGNIDVVLDGMLNLQGIGNPTFQIDTVTSDQPSPKPTTMISPTSGLITNVTLVNATGSNNGEPMINVSANGLAPGASVTVPLHFSIGSGTTPNITFNPITYQE